MFSKNNIFRVIFFEKDLESSVIIITEASRDIVGNFQWEQKGLKLWNISKIYFRIMTIIIRRKREQIAVIFLKTFA